MITIDTLGREIQLFRGKLSELPVLLHGQPACAYDDISGLPSLWVGTESEGNKRVQAEQYIIDDLVSNVADGALSARQGKILKDMIDAIGAGGSSVNVVDNLLSNSPISALSARMGRVLNEKIVNHENNVNTQKHIELVDEEPVDLTNTGVVFLRRDETSGTTPEQPTLDELKTELRNHESKISSTTELGHVKVDGTSITIDATGTIKAEIPVIQDASTTQKGIVQLSNAIDSSSIDMAATPSSVRQINNKFTLHNPINAVLASGWSLFLDNTLTYYKDSFGVVHLSGYVSGASGANGLITTMPVGYRPIKALYSSSQLGASNVTELRVNTDGRITTSTTLPANIIIEISYRTV